MAGQLREGTDAVDFPWDRSAPRTARRPADLKPAPDAATRARRRRPFRERHVGQRQPDRLGGVWVIALPYTVSQARYMTMSMPDSWPVANIG